MSGVARAAPALAAPALAMPRSAFAPARARQGAAELGGPRVLVAIHDVTPAHADLVAAAWALCRAHGATPALFVVPDWHGRWPLEAYGGFVDWLRGRVAEGAEVLLHGLRHDEVGLARGWSDRVRAAGRTDGEGEFLTLGRAAAGARIVAGLRRLRALGFDPMGFVPPAWLMRPGCLDAVAGAGLALAEDARAVYLVRTARPMLGPAMRALRAPAWRWSARTPLRAWGSAAAAALRWWTRPGRHGLVRVALHPGDLARAATRHSLDRTLARLRAGDRAVPYAALVRPGGVWQRAAGPRGAGCAATRADA